MMKKIAAAAITATILVGFQAQAHAFLGVNGVALNGIHIANGVALNGINHPNGVALNGIHIANGVALNGINHPNGVALNGIHIGNGVNLNGTKPSGRETYLVYRHPGGEGSTVLAITLPQARVTR